MARKLALTRLELKRQRDALARYRRFLPALQRRQQQLQIEVQHTAAELALARGELEAIQRRFARYGNVLGDVAGVDVRAGARPERVDVVTVNVAGVRVPEFVDVAFEDPVYSLFATAPWVEGVLAGLREQSRRAALLGVLEERRGILRRELARVVQRVNLFEKVKIPQARSAIQRIRVHLGDEMSAAVGLAKMAKGRSVEVA
jgi:V/A-type H+/Na+-transporting ATPase subunit D